MYYILFSITYFLRNGEAFLNSLHAVRFKGWTRDPVTFDKYGDSTGAYDVNVVNPLTDKWIRIGKWTKNNSGASDLGNTSRLDVDLKVLKNVWSVLYNDTGIPTSVCGSPCHPGYRMLVEEDHQVELSVASSFLSPYDVIQCLIDRNASWADENANSCEPLLLLFKGYFNNNKRYFRFPRKLFNYAQLCSHLIRQVL